MNSLTTSSSFLDNVPGVAAHKSFSFTQWHPDYMAFLCGEIFQALHILAGQVFLFAIFTIFRAVLVSLENGVVAFLPSALQVLSGTVS